MTERLLVIPILLSACVSPQPTGTIAFSSDHGGNAEIYLINAEATFAHRPLARPRV